MGTTAAIYYSQDGYDTGGTRLLGRQAAGEGFLKGLVRYGQAECLYCYCASEGEFREFGDRVRPWMHHPRQMQWLPIGAIEGLNAAGTLYVPSPTLGNLAWQRSYFDRRSYSLCGITHTTASQGAMQAIGDLLVAPFERWDAIICTSQAAKVGVESLLASWGDYLAGRTGGKPKIEVQLPVIPLGVDGDRFLPPEAAKPVGDRFRQQLGIAPEDIVILFVGRLIAHAKAHPVPGYLALERAAQATSKRLHLIQAGWFELPEHEREFKKSAAVFCPSANVIFLDGRQPEIRDRIWCAADIFLSLADNIQETFGLTPIEAMAAGLPVIVSDWNGYRESVRDGIDGLRIPTLLPPAGSGSDIARHYFEERINYSTYIGDVASLTAIDVEACSEALIRLVADGELRRKMGENGQQRVRETYDWSVVISAYEALWEELAMLRGSAPLSVYPTQKGFPHPLGDDPFRTFAHYSSQTLTDTTVVSLGTMATPEGVKAVMAFGFDLTGFELRMPPETLGQLLAQVRIRGRATIEELKQCFPQTSPDRLYRTIVYLLKFDMLKVVDR